MIIMRTTTTKEIIPVKFDLSDILMLETVQITYSDKAKLKTEILSNYRKTWIYPSKQRHCNGILDIIADKSIRDYERKYDPTPNKEIAKELANVITLLAEMDHQISSYEYEKYRMTRKEIGKSFVKARSYFSLKPLCVVGIPLEDNDYYDLNHESDIYYANIIRGIKERIFKTFEKFEELNGIKIETRGDKYGE